MLKLGKVGLALVAALLVVLAGDHLRTWFFDTEPKQQAEDAEAGLRATRQNLVESIGRVQGLARMRQAPARVLDQVSRVVPDLVWLERLSLREKKVTISGRASDTYGVADFIESLGAVRGFAEPETESIELSGGEYSYSLAFSFDPALLTSDTSEDDPPEQPAGSGDPVGSAEELRAEIAALETRLDGLLPSAKQTDDLLRRIRTLALRHEVILTKFTPRQIIVDDFYRRWPVDVSLEAPYHGLVAFLAQIGGIGRVVVPHDLDVVTGGSGVTANLVLTAYLKAQGTSDPPAG